MAVRAYHNGDLGELVRVWNAHHGPRAGVAVTGAQVQMLVLGSPGFRHEDVTVHTDDADRVDGWVHRVGDVAVMLAIDPAGSADAAELLAAADVTMFGPTPADAGGYLGVSPLTAGGGYPADDEAVAASLRSAGWSVDTSFTTSAIAVRGYRPPVNRELLQLRRTAPVAFVESPADDPEQAAATAHLDRHVANLPGGEDRIEIFRPDCEAAAVVGRHAVLRRPASTPPDARLTHVVSAAIQELAGECFEELWFATPGADAGASPPLPGAETRWVGHRWRR